MFEVLTTAAICAALLAGCRLGRCTSRSPRAERDEETMMDEPRMRHRYIRHAETGKSIDALLTATWLLAAWGSIVRWLETGEALLDADQQADLRMTLTNGKYGRHAIVLEPGGSGWGNTLRLACFTDDAFEKRLLTDRMDARQFHWRPAAEPRIDGVRAHLAGGAIIEATWSENGAGEALLVADDAGGGGSWGTQTDRRNGKPIAWPPREAVEAGVARAAEVARGRAMWFHRNDAAPDGGHHG